MIKRVLRALGLLLSLAWAVIVGIAIRYGRRWLGRPPRIWFGFMPIHFLKELAATARHAGYPARTVVATSRQVKYALVWDDLFDRVLDSARMSASIQDRKSGLCTTWLGCRSIRLLT